MKANAVPILAVFEKKMRLEVPLFQRQYVWSRENQWEPLWEDIARKFSEYLGGRKDAPTHFLGAMVLDQKQTPTTHVEKRQVIDGQQRLTTLQIFLAALRDFCRERDCVALAEECEGYTVNKGMMADPQVDKFKVWPTQLDRSQFTDVITSASRAELEKRHPLTWKKYARKPLPRARMVEAYIFFYDQLNDFFIGTDSEPPLAAETPLAERLEECFQSLKNALQVVVIDLDQDDDAQVIFETLNARGEPLLPADLLRNFIFLRAARQGASQEDLYNEYWRRFDDPFWRIEVKQGRLLRPRSDLFMQHFLASRQTVDIPIKHLFVEYKFWIERQRPFKTITEELAALARQGEDFRRIIEPKKGDAIYALATFLDAFDIRTAYPLLLSLLDARMTDAQWVAISATLESYLLRRAVCGLTTKNYNNIFLSLCRNLRKEGFSPENLSKQLMELKGESTEWPSDAAFGNSWRDGNAYESLGNPKLVHIFKRINETYVTGKMEALSLEGSLTVEHLLPQNWQEHWPLPDGSKGLDFIELFTAPEGDARAAASRVRNAALQTLGNLTIVTQPLNSAASNAEWKNKRSELISHSLLPINQHLYAVETWDEKAIAARGADLFARAIKLWPRK
jgi:uncharacterized protein with ParB-like and HNH nuclease domain